MRLTDPIPWLAGLSLAGVLVLGLVLRFQLAGWGLGQLSFVTLRSAHSHLAWYGLVFPFVWMGWKGSGVGGVRPLWGWLYAGATVLATAAFAWSGYNLVSIAGSTVVLLVWLGWALPLFRRLLRRDWAGIAGPAVLAAACAIPAVAVLSKRGDPMAPALVQAFLTWLLLGVALPAALHRLKAPAPPAWLATPLVLAAGLALGPWPNLWTRAALVGVGLGLMALAWFIRASLAERLAVAVLGGGLALVGAHIVPDGHHIAIAGLHFAALGPVAFTLCWPGRRDIWALPYLTIVAGFAASIAGMAFWPHPGWFTAAAVLGVLLVCLWGAAGVVSHFGADTLSNLLRPTSSG